MLVIRLQRTGRTNLPTYRIVVAEKARAVKGKFLEIIGHYLPAQKNPVFECKTDRVDFWVKKGAIPSDTLARMLKAKGVKGMDPYILRYAKRRPKGEQPEEPAAAAKAEAPAAEPVAAGAGDSGERKE